MAQRALLAAPLRRFLALLLAACAAGPAHARAHRAAGEASAEHGAYLGCYDAAALRLAFSGPPSATHSCAAACAAAAMPIYSLNRALQCACAAAVPRPSAQLPDGACEAARSANAAPVFYIHADPSQSCAAEKLPLGWDGFDAAYGNENAEFDRSTDALALRMRGAAGVRVAARAGQLYGMLSFRARASGAPGVISAAYVSRGRLRGRMAWRGGWRGSGRRWPGSAVLPMRLGWCLRGALRFEVRLRQRRLRIDTHATPRAPIPTPPHSCVPTSRSRAPPALTRSVRRGSKGVGAHQQRPARPQRRPRLLAAAARGRSLAACSGAQTLAPAWCQATACPPARPPTIVPSRQRPSPNMHTPTHTRADLQWLNGAPAPAPGSLWLSTHRRGATQTEAAVAPAEYARLTSKGTKLSDDYHTYAIDWQPDHVSW